MTYREQSAELKKNERLCRSPIDIENYGCPDTYLDTRHTISCAILTGECMTCAECWDREAK